MSILAATVGRFLPRFRTLDQWIEVYLPLVKARQIKSKTMANRMAHIRRISKVLGRRRIGSIRPHEINALIANIYTRFPVAAKRTLVEIRSMLDEAVANGWIEFNAGKAVRLPRTKVRRRRLMLAEWMAIFEHARAHRPPWVHRLLLLALVTGQRRGDIAKMRFSDVWPDESGELYLHIVQEKTGMRIALPISLRLEVIGISIGDAIELCKSYAPLEANGDGYLLRKTTGSPPCAVSMSWRFEQSREAVLPPESGTLRPPTLHECRSLSEREYRKQGINTMYLLGHTRQRMTDLYNDDRGLEAREGRWRTLELPAS